MIPPFQNGGPIEVNRERIEELITFVVLTTSVNRTRLMKYVYLADLAYAKTHAGETYTGANWRFLHFGPWSSDVNDAIDSAMQKAGAEVVTYEHGEHGEHAYWRVRESNRPKKPNVNVTAAMEIERAAKNYEPLPDLLHRVYATAPVLNAGPNEPLDFSTALTEPPPTWQTVEPLTAKQQKKLKSALAEVHKKIDERRAQQPRKRIKVTPVYSQDFFAIEKAVDEQMGPAIEPEEVELTFEESIWKSGARIGKVP